jgi:hypothetical protein
MPTTTDEDIELEEKEDVDSPSDMPEFADGELCPVDASDDRVDLDDLEDDQVSCLEQLAQRAASRDQTSYRTEVRDAWKERYFYRGNQYLLANKNGSWAIAKSVLATGASYDDTVASETNIYLAFGDTISAALTAGTPSVRFEADDAGNPADITAAVKSDGARRLIERANDMLTLQAELSRFLWTDGRGLFYTHHVLDAQRFGYTNNDYDEELSFLEEDDATGEQEPRSQQVIECFGALETKLAIQARDIHESDYLQLMREFDVSRLKTKYPNSAEKIVAAAAPTAQSDYVRLARSSVNMGMRPANMSNDAQSYNATETLTWVRPSFYETEENDELRKWLLSEFPKGAMIAQVGKLVVEVRTESIDDHWTLFHGRPGDGMHRPSLGRPVVPLQEKLNDCMDLVHESFMHLIPRIWLSPKIDAAGAEATRREPGQYMKAPPAVEGKAIADNFYAEPQIQLAEGLLTFIENLFGTWSQFLCGAFPALFGGDTGSNDTAKGIGQQRDAALGRLGLTWRGIKAGYARTIKQAVEGVAEHQKGTFAGTVPTGDGKKEYLEIATDDLKGNVKCFADTDENFPESWVAQRAVWSALVQQAEKNPILAKWISSPKNLLTAKDKLGVPEMVIPEAASEKKQLAEIKLLLEGEPQPNPDVQKAQQAMVNVKQAVQLGKAPPETIATIQKQADAIPPLVSSVPINKLLDFHMWEANAIQTFANSDDGVKAAQEKPQGFANIQLHFQEHMTEAEAQAQKAAQANKQPPKPPSESMNFKDMPPEGQVQMALQDGIKLDLNALKVEDAQEKQATALAGAAKVSGATGNASESGKPKSGA